MNHKDFPRLYELQGQTKNLQSAGAYNFDTRNEPVIVKHLRDIEAELQGLNVGPWNYLKAELVPLLASKDAKRGWQRLFDKLNEAKGHNYLVRIGCTNVEFIPRSSRTGEKTPDLQGSLGATKVLCEVKTINISEVESAHRKNGSVRTIVTRLPIEFFNKLKSTLETARNQMAVYCPAAGTKKIAYVIVNYDDILHEYDTNYAAQLDTFVASKPVPDLDIVFDIKPAFYAAIA